MRILLVVLLLLFPPAGFARAQDASAEEPIRSVIAQWYAELAKREDGRIESIVAPNFINSTPHYVYADSGSAALGPPIYNSLAATALRFAYDIDAMRIDQNFAKVDVWERGYFYAFAAEKTYERAASTVFVLERRQADGRWLILAHHSGSYGIPPNRITNPMPDLRDLHHAAEGRDRDPGADAFDEGKF